MVVSNPRTFDVVLERPVVSEKSYDAISTRNQYTFRCPLWVTKVDVLNAVAAAFAVEVEAVNIMRVRGKTRRRSRGRQRVQGQSPNWKKAVVTLEAGQKIEGLFEGV